MFKFFDVFKNFRSKWQMKRDLDNKEKEFKKLESSVNDLYKMIESVTERDKIVTMAKNELETIFDSINEYVIVVDCNDIIQRVNKPAASLINKNPSEILQTHISEHFNDFANLLGEIYECGNTNSEVKKTFYSKQFEKYFDCNIRRIINSEKDLICINIYQDVTNQKITEEIFNKIKETLSSEKFSDKEKIQEIDRLIKYK
mgnify:CR=1 FL=1